MRWDWDSDQLGNVIRSKANLFSLSFLLNNSQPLATPQIPAMQPILCLFLWISGVFCLEKFEGPLFQATCPQAFLCEPMYCGSENNNGALPVNTLLPTNLTTSTILYCEQNKGCIPCIRVQLTVSLAESRWNLGVSGSISKRSKDFDTDEGSRDEDYNEDFGLIHVSSHQPEGGVNNCVQLKIQFPRTDHGYNRSSRSRPTGTVELSCFQAFINSEVLIKAFTEPENQMHLQHTHKVEDCTLKDFLENIEWCKVPSLNVTLENKIQMAVVNVPQNCYTRFKYEVTPEFESKNPLDTDKLKVTEVRRNFSEIVPCLCMEVWSATMEDARRHKECPFSEEEFQGNIWKLSSLAVEFKRKALQWTFSSPCNMLGEISLCSKARDGALCHEIPHSRQDIEVNKLNEYSNVDPHPSLCIKIISGDNVNFSCPFDAELSLPWKVESKVMQSEVTVTILHKISKMNFSICTVKGGKCEHFLHNIKEINQQMKQLDLGSQDCFQVWRSDVNFSPRITVCPFDMYTRARWTPLLVLLLILAIIVIVTITVKKKLLKGCIEVIKWDYSATAPTAAGSPINRKVLLLYSLDHNQFEKLVNTFASVLFELNFQVTVDLWKRREMGAQGPLPWIHSQKNKIAEEGGKILILFSKGAGMKCNEWLQSSGGTGTIHDPYDGFMASLNCVLPDIIKGNVSGKYVVAYFEDLQNKAEIPELFNKMPIYNLPSQLTEFLQEIGAQANYKPVQKATSYQSTISDRLNGDIKECQLWEQNHSTWYQDHYELEGTSEGQEESDAMMHCPLIKMEMLSMV
ncbi:interleukin-17 receptor C-like isoform X2 [Heptranchias perlo]|uniref:interleukin-17 receptor C-like isoform X2 n=1 Tax=Heptranchias perlo TaxID=212740 RepID=UPI0035597C58